MEKRIVEKFGNHIRIRVCGVLIIQDSILLVKHRFLGQNGVLWAPPGGGMQFGERAEETLKREFLEETGLKVRIDQYLFTHEFLKPPLHAIELFFKVDHVDGKLRKGRDPEMHKHEQIIEQVAFLTISQLKKIQTDSLHYVLQKVHKLNDLFNYKGYVKFEDFA